MKLDKVIEILQINIGEGRKKMPPDVLTALSIAMEALKKIQYDRLPGNHPLYPYLPGETTQEDE